MKVRKQVLKQNFTLLGDVVDNVVSLSWQTREKSRKQVANAKNPVNDDCK